MNEQHQDKINEIKEKIKIYKDNIKKIKQEILERENVYNNELHNIINPDDLIKVKNIKNEKEENLKKEIEKIRKKINNEEKKIDKENNFISIKAIDGILDHNKRSFYTSYLDQPDEKLSIDKLKERQQKIINELERKTNEKKNEIKKFEEMMKDLNDNIYPIPVKEEIKEEIKEIEKEIEKISVIEEKYNKEIEKINIKINKEANKEKNKDNIPKPIENQKSDATSLKSLFNEIVSDANKKNPVKKGYNPDICFDIDNFSNLMNLIIKIIYFIIIIFLLLIFVFSILNLILILYYIINDNINIYFNKDYILSYVYSYKIIADMITNDSVYLFINSSENLVINNFIIIIIIFFIIIICYLYVFLKSKSCNSSDDNTYVKGSLNIDKKYLFLLILIFIFLLFHYLIFKFFYGYIMNKYSEILKKQMDMSKKIGKMIGSIRSDYIDIFVIKNGSYEEIDKFLYQNSIINSIELNNYLLVFSIFNYLSNIDKTLINTYLNDNLNNNFFELLPFKDPLLIKKDYEKLNFLNLDKEKLNIKNISDQLILLNNNINNINKFIIENNKLIYPSYLVLIYCLIIIFLIIITLLSIYKINGSF
jgi:hypothetical protein